MAAGAGPLLPAAGADPALPRVAIVAVNELLDCLLQSGDAAEDAPADALGDDFTEECLR